MDSSTPTTPTLDPHIQTPHPSRRKPLISMHSPSPVSLQDLLLLSPAPYKKPSRGRRPSLIVDECIDVVAGSVVMNPRRRGKSRAAGVSPRNARRARRRLEKEGGREEVEEDGGRSVRKKRQSSRATEVLNKESLALVDSSIDSPSRLQKDEGCKIADGMGELMVELVMWKNAAKSSLWFGLGTMFFLASCLSKDVNFSMISAISHLGLLVLGLAFFYDSVPERRQLKPRGETFQLTEESILGAARLILPVANAALAKSQEVFSGEPLMTLKVAPVLIFMAKYGHLITPWRLFATGFFLSFTIPKLYACYSDHIHKKVEDMRSYVWEAWKSCPLKKFVAATATTMMWNLFSLKMRFFAAFISIVILRYYHQRGLGRSAEVGKGEGVSAKIESRDEETEYKEEENAENVSGEGKPEKAITVAE